MFVSSSTVNSDLWICAIDRLDGSLRKHKAAEWIMEKIYRSLLAVLHHLVLFNLLCHSINGSTNKEWFVDRNQKVKKAVQFVVPLVTLTGTNIHTYFMPRSAVWRWEGGRVWTSLSSSLVLFLTQPFSFCNNWVKHYKCFLGETLLLSDVVGVHVVWNTFFLVKPHI